MYVCMYVCNYLYLSIIVFMLGQVRPFESSDVYGLAARVPGRPGPMVLF